LRLGYRNRHVDLGGSLTPTGPVVRGSVSLNRSTRVGVEHNPLTNVTKPYIEEKGNPLRRRELLRRLVEK
jgi:hypothetical protein